MVTLAPIPFASGSLARDVMAEANLLPFWSKVTRSEVGVPKLKNFSQFAVISDVAAAGFSVVAEPLAGLAGDDAADEEAGALDEEADADGLELLLLQAAAVMARIRPRAAATALRRASIVNRMTRLPCRGGRARECRARGSSSGTRCVLAQFAPDDSPAAAGYPWLADMDVR